MEKIINFEYAANKTKRNKQSGAEKADFPDFAEWYAEYILDHKSDFIRLVMPYVRDTAESACQLAALNFKNFYLIPESLLCFLNLVEEGAGTSIPCAAYTWTAKSGTTYTLRVTATLPDDEDDDVEFVAHLEKEDADGEYCHYDFNSKAWVKESNPIKESYLYQMHQGLTEKHAPEADMVEALLDAGLDDLTEKEYQSLKSKHNPLFRLYNATKSFMAPLLIPTEYIRFNSKKPNAISVGEEDAILCLVPDDMRKHGFIVAEDGDQLVLFQYLDPDDIAPVIDSDIYEDLCIEHGIYIHEAGRTADIDVMKRALYAMAYRYTKNDLYIFPVSLYAATETFDLKKAGRKAHKWTGKELTEEEKKSLERTKKRVRRYASKFNLI